MFDELRASLVLLFLFTLLLGIGYPLLTTNIGQSFFPYQSSGSLAEQDGKIIGSTLLGQNFESDKYFHARPSAAGNGYDAGNSSGSNLAPTAKDLLKTYTERVEELRKSGDDRAIPVDMVTASGSGLDPDISVAAANFQAMRIADARNIPMPQIQKLINEHITPPTFGLLGQSRVNVLALNRALDLVPVAPAPATAPTPAP